MKIEEDAGDWILGELVIAECGKPFDAITEISELAGDQDPKLRN
jgi:hypothetical protein